MEATFYLVLGAKGSVRTSKRAPRLNWNEISMQLNVNVPDEIFQRPMLQANVTIPTDVVRPNPITADVVDNVEQAIRDATGLDFSVRFIDYDDARRRAQDENYQGVDGNGQT